MSGVAHGPEFGEFRSVVPVGEDTRLLESMIELSCGAANGLLDPTQIANAIWARFQSLDVSRKWMDGSNYIDGQPLFYYGNSLPPTPPPDQGFSQGALLNIGWGRCAAWAQLLHSCMTLQGVSGSRVGLVPIWYPPYEEEVLIVREFTTAGSSSGVPKYPYLASDLVPQDGIPAQNNFNPNHVSFANHCINNYPVLGYADPSYGLKRSHTVPYENDVLFVLGKTMGATWVYRLQVSAWYDLVLYPF